MNNYQGISEEQLQSDIIKLEYQNNEINKELVEFCNIKNELEKKYTSPIDQNEINDNLQKKINQLRNNRDNDINLLKDKIIIYENLIEDTKNKISKIETNTIVE